MGTAERIKECRKKLGLSQIALSEILGISYMTVRRWETLKRAPSTAIMPKLAEALHTSVAYLMELEDGPAPGQEPLEPPSKEPEKEPADTPDMVKVDTQTRDHGELYYRFANGSEVRLPDTPENKVLFEKLITQGLGAGKA